MRYQTVVFYLLLTFIASGCFITRQKEEVESPTLYPTLTRQPTPPLDLSPTEAPRLETACDSFQFEAHETWDIWYTPSLAFDAAEGDMIDEMLTLQLFCQWLQYFKVAHVDEKYRLNDYAIHHIEFSGLTRLAKEHKVESTAWVIYSVKPAQLLYSDWVAGNGTIDNEWVSNKSVIVGLYKNDGFYKMKLIQGP